MQSEVLNLVAVVARLLPMPLKRAFYRIKPLARWIRRGLNRVAPEGYTLVKIAAGELAGCQMWLDLQSEKDYWLGTYEPGLQRAVSDLVRPGMVAYDVGANIGYISLLLARAVGETGQVHAFEALPANVDRLSRNLAANEVGAHVRVIPAAVVGQSGPVRFWIGPSSGMGKAEGSAGRNGIAYRQEITVPGLCLDEYCCDEGRPVPHIVKIDIEGGEVLALPGMRRLLAECQPLLFLELHGPQAAQVAWETLTALGYSLCRLEPGYPRLTGFQSLNWKTYAVCFPVSKPRPQWRLK
jgi:FkbM family methyltransferase